VAVEPNKVDGIQSFVGGMNQSLPSALLKEDATYKNINVSLLNGKISPRPKLVEIEFKLPNPNERPAVGSLTYKENLYAGRIQHSGRFKTSLGEYVITVVNGVIYALRPKTGEAFALKNQSEPKFLNYKAVRLEGCQAYNYYVIFDWPNQVVIIDNQLKVRRAVIRNTEVPRSYLGAFVHNRLFVANKGIEFGASDPVRPDAPLAPLTFLDSIVSESNPSPLFPEQFFSLSYIERLSSITAMGHFERTGGASSTGFGPLFIATKEGIFSYNVNQPRSQWTQSVFGTVLVSGIGIVGPRSFSVVGGDIWYRGPDGHIYTISTVASDQQRWGVSNISREIEESLKTVNKHLLQYSSLTYHDNKILCHLQPYAVKSSNIMGAAIDDYVFNGLGVVQLNSISGIGGGAAPVWSSVYNVVSTDFVKIDESLVIVGKAKHNETYNAFYALDDDATHDVIRGTPVKIRSRIYTRELDLQSPLQDKKLTYLKLDIRNIVGDLHVAVYARMGDEWDKIGEMLASDVSNTDNEFIPLIDPKIIKSTQLRIDLEGSRYEFTRAFLVGELYTDLQPEHNLEVDTPCESHNCLGDSEL